MKTLSLGIARHYARALLDVALQEGSAEALRGELRDAVGLLREQKELSEALGNPAISPERKKAIVLAVWAEGRGSALFRRLLGLLVDNRRIDALPAIEDAYASLWNIHRHVAAAEVVSAVPLEAAQQGRIASALEKATGMGVEVRTIIDPEVLGGVLVRVAGKSYDGTVRASLRALKERLSSGA